MEYVGSCLQNGTILNLQKGRIVEVSPSGRINRLHPPSIMQDPQEQATQFLMGNHEHSRAMLSNVVDLSLEPTLHAAGVTGSVSGKRAARARKYQEILFE